MLCKQDVYVFITLQLYMVSLCCDRNYGFGRTLFVLAYTPVLLLVHLPLVILLDYSLHIDYLISLLVAVVSPMDTHENSTRDTRIRNPFTPSQIIATAHIRIQHTYN